MRTVSLTARVRDASGHETSALGRLAVDDGPLDRLSARPNDGSGLWPDFSNTGFAKSPGYAGLIDWKPGMSPSGWLPLDLPSGTVVQFKRFAGKVGVNYNTHGSKDITFVGCLFEGTMPDDNLLQIYTGGRVTFKHCTFRPAGLTVPPGNNGTVSSSRTHPGTPYNRSWQYISTMVDAAVVTFDHCDIWGNAGIQAAGGNSPAEPAIFSNCYLHDCSDTDGSGGSGYHHDGIGPNSEGGGHDIVIDNCTIASLGNTNGIALQGQSTYSRVKVTGCYLSGWGIAACIGATQPWRGTHITFTDNVYSTELPALFAPWYGGAGSWNNGGGTNAWARNRFQVRVNDGNTSYPLSANGKFLWPDNAAHINDYTG